jgi:GDPmannose 4,6-dehydratase
MTASNKTALITGVTGQDGSYLAELLLDKGYKVIGVSRRSTHYRHENIDHLGGRLILEYGDLIDAASIERLVAEYQPDEVYNIAAQSVPADSWTQPIVTAEITAVGTLRVLEAVRKSYDMFACGGILFNHESPRRSLHFVTRKVTMAVACIKCGVKNPPLNEAGEPLVKDGKLHLGNLDAVRDWGHAQEYVEAMWLMLQQDEPENYIIATNRSNTLRELCDVAFAHAGLDWQEHVDTDERFMRPTEIAASRGDFSKAKAKLGWSPKISFEELIRLMVDADIARLS